MFETKIWCRKCIVCQRIDEIEYSNHQDGCGSCAVVRTTLPDQSLQGVDENYRCRSCRSRLAYESHELNNQIMEAREENKYGSYRHLSSTELARTAMVNFASRKQRNSFQTATTAAPLGEVLAMMVLLWR
ncbi:uncharacterized protein BKA55DRAFT_690201 [Fusarium redolens]|uniref:Uncharacterized protein n=1 Tax=Fusarium redolens TaxID=48865 RepID=A0A9P9H2R1_FUSRE|nr:uncharacterized protein BKA55DRAFT_690201 [Fusarium redolens]KAH7249961.1 hypothetical protein BKA55DRAFT_690201 [Fusarium redolens]